MPKKQKQSKYYEQYFQIFTYFNNLWNKIIRKHVFKVKVENQPKVQDVKITNPQAPQSSLKVSNFEQVEQALNKNVIDIIKFLEKKMEELKVEPTDNSDILKSLKGIRKELKKLFVSMFLKLRLKINLKFKMLRLLIHKLPSLH